MSKYIKLSPEGMMPTIGFGTWQAAGDEIKNAVNSALESGYRHIDTAYAYENEQEIGEVLHEWLSSGRVKREELFIVTKLPPFRMSPSGVHKSIKESMEKLQIDYLDLYLIHTPFGFKDGEVMYPRDEDGNMLLDMETDHVAIWKAMEEYVKNGKVKAIGISNFNVRQIERVYANAEIKPCINQVELHLFCQQKELAEVCKEKGIRLTAYSPLGSIGSPFLKGVKNQLPSIMTQPDVVSIAEAVGKTPAQVVLRMIIQKGFVAIPKSTTPSHIKANLDIYDFELSDDMMEKLEALDLGDGGKLLRMDFFTGVVNHPEYPFNVLK